MREKRVGGGEGEEKAQRGAPEASKLLLSVTTKQMCVGVMPSRTSILKIQCLLCARLSSDPTSSLQWTFILAISVQKLTAARERLLKLKAESVGFVPAVPERTTKTVRTTQ